MPSIPINRLNSPGQIYEYLSDAGVTPSHALGQNFLTDRNILCQFVESLEIDAQDRIVEIGPGLGHFTQALLSTGAALLAIEKDARLAEHLPDRLGEPEGLTVWACDALEITAEQILEWSQGERIILAGNLPYSFSSHILTRLFEEWFPVWGHCGFLLQEEVVDRLVSPPGKKDYGRLSLLAQIFSQPQKLRRVSPHLFIPAPAVNSAWVTLFQREGPFPLTAEQVGSVSALCFAERRKTLANNLGREFGKEKANAILGSLALDGMRRSETLSIDEFSKLALAVLSALETSQKNPSGNG